MIKIKQGDILILANRKIAEVFQEGDIHIYDMDRTLNLRDYDGYDHNKNFNFDIVQILRPNGKASEQEGFNLDKDFEALSKITESLLTPEEIQNTRQELDDLMKKLLEKSISKLEVENKQGGVVELKKILKDLTEKQNYESKICNTTP